MIRDTEEIQRSNIWEEAAKQKSKQNQSSGVVEKTFIVVGPAGSGKSSFIKVFKSDLDFDTKPTNLLEFTHIKKQSVNIKKEVINCYEIASKSLMEVTLSLVNKDNFQNVIFILCVDLGKCGSSIQEVLEWVDLIRKEGQKIINEKFINQRQKYQEFRSNMLEPLQAHEDRQSIKPLPFHTMIIGMKYDQYEKYDTENRKWLARALRFISHYNNASLYFCSTKNMQVGAQLRAYVQQKILSIQQKRTGATKNTGSKIAPQFDHTKPIFVSNGEDTIRSMNLPSAGSMSTTDILKKQLGSLFGEDDEKKKEPLDLSKYGQSRIDSIISQKKKQLERIVKMLQTSQSRTQKKL